MPRQTTDQQIATRAARERLAPRAEPYWRGVDAGAALGYRRTAKGGFWVARVMSEGRYRKSAIGKADDALKAAGNDVLAFRQAEAKAREWAARRHRKAAGMEADASRTPYTVGDAMRDYVADYRLRGGKAAGRTQDIIRAHIALELGPVRLDRLTRQRVERWRDALATAAPRLRMSGKPGASSRTRQIDADDPNATRARRASANRVLTVLKAALNHAHGAGSVADDTAWKLAKPFKNVDAPRVRHLDDSEAVRLLNSCNAEFQQIVAASLLTGMRYGEIVGMKAADFQQGAISLSDSKSGKPRLIHLTDEGRDFFAAAVAGKERGALVFRRGDGEPWGRSHQFRPLRKACSRAKIDPAVSFHILRHTYASRLVMRGVPLGVVAQQIGDSEAITSKHYAHLAPSYVADMVRQALREQRHSAFVEHNDHRSAFNRASNCHSRSPCRFVIYRPGSFALSSSSDHSELKRNDTTDPQIVELFVETGLPRLRAAQTVAVLDACGEYTLVGAAGGANVTGMTTGTRRRSKESGIRTPDLPRIPTLAEMIP